MVLNLFCSIDSLLINFNERQLLRELCNIQRASIFKGVRLRLGLCKNKLIVIIKCSMYIVSHLQLMTSWLCVVFIAAASPREGHSWYVLRLTADM